MTSTRLPRRTAPRAPRRPALTGAGLGTVLTLTLLTGCTPTDQDDRPTSDYATLAEELRALPGVTCVEHATAAAVAEPAGASATEPCAAATGPPSGSGTTYTVVLDPGTREAELRTAAQRSDALVNDHRYPSGAPEVTVEYGEFTAEIPHTGRNREVVACADACGGGRLDFTDFLDLRQLPDVRAGALTEHGADVVLADGADSHSWVEDALATDVHLRLRVHTAKDMESAWLTLSLGADGTAESVQALLEIAESTGARIVTASDVQNIQHATATLRVAEAADIGRVHDALIAEYPQGAMNGFEIVTDDGFEVRLSGTGSPIDSVVDAQRMLEDAGATVDRIGGGGSYVELIAPDSDALRSTVDLVSGDSWPLSEDTAVRIRRADDSEYQASFAADDWGERAPLLRDLWNAGFVEVEYREDHGDLSTALAIGPEPDFTAPAGRDALVRALRGTGWPGSARITLAAGSHPTFESTRTGTAQNVLDSLHDPGDELSDWGRDFIDAWDASATTG